MQPSTKTKSKNNTPNLTREGDRPKTQNLNFKVEDNTNNTRSCENKVDLQDTYNFELKQKMEIGDRTKIVFEQSGSGVERVFWRILES